MLLLIYCLMLMILTAIQVPERYFPYKFDIFGASHQILHFAVIVAAVIHYCGLLNAFSIIRSDIHTCDKQMV